MGVRLAPNEAARSMEVSAKKGFTVLNFVQSKKKAQKLIFVNDTHTVCECDIAIDPTSGIDFCSHSVTITVIILNKSHVDLDFVGHP